MRRLTAAVMVGILTPACAASEGSVEVTEARMGAPTGANAAVYLTVRSPSPDRLVGAETEAASRAELHETTMGEDGTMSMRPVEGFEIDAGRSLALEPGGRHVMLVDVEALSAGDSIELRLVLERAGEIDLEVPVVEPQEVVP